MIPGRPALAAAVLLGCSNGGSAFDAGVDSAGADGGVCPVTIEAFCAAHACPKTQAEAIAWLCAQSPYVVACGNSAAGYVVDQGSGYDFDDAGALTAIAGVSNGVVSCTAGPADASVGICASVGPSICPACTRDQDCSTDGSRFCGYPIDDGCSAVLQCRNACTPTPPITLCGCDGGVVVSNVGCASARSPVTSGDPCDAATE